MSKSALMVVHSMETVRPPALCKLGAKDLLRSPTIGDHIAIYYAGVKSFSRGKGERSIAAAAGRAGLDLVDTNPEAFIATRFAKGVAAPRAPEPSVSLS